MQLSGVAEADARGRTVLPSKLRTALGLTSGGTTAAIHATVVWPDALRGHQQQFEASVTKQGRFTIPEEEREWLGIDGRPAMLQLVVAVDEPVEPPDL